MSRDTRELSDRALRSALLGQVRACQEQPGLFFEPEEETPAARALREQAAAVLCTDCPVRTLCLAYAVRNREQFGIWAGYTAREVAALAVDTADGEVA